MKIVTHTPKKMRCPDAYTRYKRRHNSLCQCLRVVKQKPGSQAGVAYCSAMDIFVRGLISNTESLPTLLPYLQIAKDMFVLNFRHAIEAGGPIGFIINGQHYESNDSCEGSFISLPYWLATISLCLMFRDKDSIHHLLKYQEEHLAQSVVSTAEVELNLLELFKAAIIGRGDLGSLIKAVMHSSDPDLIPYPQQNYIYKILMPVSNLYVLLATKSTEDKYQEVYENALRSHKKFWGAEDNMYARDGWLSFLLMGVSALAYDRRGYRIPVDSDYVLRELVYGEYEVDAPWHIALFRNLEPVEKDGFIDRNSDVFSRSILIELSGEDLVDPNRKMDVVKRFEEFIDAEATVPARVGGVNYVDIRGFEPGSKEKIEKPPADLEIRIENNKLICITGEFALKNKPEVWVNYCKNRLDKAFEGWNVECKTYLVNRS